MNANPRTEFTEEEVVAFVYGTGSESTNARIESDMEVDEDLAAQVAILRALRAQSQSDLLSKKQSPNVREESLDTVSPESEEETVAPKREKESTAGEDGELRQDLRAIATLERQGLTPKQIAEQMGVTKTLVDLKLQRIRSWRSKNRG